MTKNFVARKKFGNWVVFDLVNNKVVETFQKEKACKNRVRDLNKAILQSRELGYNGNTRE
jgi:hypothetical protein